MRKKNLVIIGVFVGVIFLGLIGLFFELSRDNNQKADDKKNSLFEENNPERMQQACSMDARICPDGTAVGRTGPDCEFSPCPDEAEGENNMVGNDRDEHGCIGSAGYSWCEARQKCLRSWEESC